MVKQKITGLGLSLLLLFGMSGAVLANAPLTAGAESNQSEPAATETVALKPGSAESDGNAELFLPASYEQYLPLKTPSYVTMDERRIIVADGKLLYFYDRAAGRYSFYDTELKDNATVEKVQITDEGRLFFSSNGLLYEYSFEKEAAEEIKEVACATFLVKDGYLYTVRAGETTYTLNYYPLNELNRDGEKEILTITTSIRPKLTAAGDNLYCIRENTDVVTYDVGGQAPVYRERTALDKTSERQITNLKFACVYGGSLYYTVDGTTETEKNGLYRTDFAGNSVRLIKEDGFSAVTTYENELYCVQNSSVLRLKPEGDGVVRSGYEIASSSDSVNRLSHAEDAVRAGDLLVTSDKRGRRISVYNFATERYSSIACDFSPNLVATDGTLIAVSSGESVYTCTYGEETFTLSKKTNSEIKGLACVYGTVYYVTEIAYGKAGEAEEHWHNAAGTPARLTRDLYGTLYVAYANGSVRAYSEEAFLNNADAGTLLPASLPANYVSLRADFEGNVYCLAGGTLYKNGEAFAAINGKDYVYEGTENPVSFALGFEDDEVYFLFGNYYVKSKAETLNLPTLKKIATEGAKESVFGVHGTENLLADVPAGAIGIRTDAKELREGDFECFPYAGYYRLNEAAHGVLLAETEKYYAVLLYRAENRAYTLSLFRKSGVRILAEEEYWQEDGSVAYLSNRVSSYFAPTLEAELADAALPRGLRVTVLGVVSTLEYDYAKISYATEAKSVAYGFVPASYLSDVSPASDGGDTFLPGYIKANKAGIEFVSEDGEDSFVVTERTKAKLAEQEDGTYLAAIERNGKIYTAHVSGKAVDWGESDALRISLIVILTVLALVIIGAYVYLLPRKSAERKPKKEKRAKTKKNNSNR